MNGQKDTNPEQKTSKLEQITAFAKLASNLASDLRVGAQVLERVAKKEAGALDDPELVNRVHGTKYEDLYTSFRDAYNAFFKPNKNKNNDQDSVQNTTNSTQLVIYDRDKNDD